MNLTFNLLLPVFTGLLAGLALLGYLYYLKGREISTGRLIIWLIWTLVLFGFTGLLAVKIDALPYGFAAAATGALLFGILYLTLAPLTFNFWHRSDIAVLLLTNFIFLCFGVTGFSVIYVMAADSPDLVYTFLVSILACLLPALIVRSYDFWMQIPKKKYKTWLYPLHAEVPKLQPIDPIRLMMNFTPVPTEKNEAFESYEVEFPTNESLSDLFHYFISFHNKHREYRKKPIQFLEGDVPLEWVLFKFSPQKKKIFLDMDKTLIENHITANDHIYASSSGS